IGSILGCALPFLVGLQFSKQYLRDWNLAFFFVLRLESPLCLGGNPNHMVLKINITPSAIADFFLSHSCQEVKQKQHSFTVMASSEQGLQLFRFINGTQRVHKLRPIALTKQSLNAIGF